MHAPTSSERFTALQTSRLRAHAAVIAEAVWRRFPAAAICRHQATLMCGKHVIVAVRVRDVPAEDMSAMLELHTWDKVHECCLLAKARAIWMQYQSGVGEK